jgi:hypothetical protein
MSELEEGKAKFLQLIQSIEPGITVVIPTVATNDLFLISLAKGPQKKFITVSEDDLIDLPNDPSTLRDVTEQVKEALADLSS